MVKLQYTFQSRDDLKNIYSFIASDSVFHAKRVINSSKLNTEILKSYPEIRRLVYPGRFENLRQLLYKYYRAIYHYSFGIVTIITIHHQSPLLENIPAIREHNE